MSDLFKKSALIKNNFKTMKVFSSSRFWSLVVVAALGLLTQYGLLPVEIMQALVTVLLGHVGIRTVDRFSEKVGKTVDKEE